MKCLCGRPTSGGAWCTKPSSPGRNDSCRHTVDVAIGNVAAYFDDLDTVRTRRTSYGGLAAVGSVGKSQPLVVDAAFLPGGRGALAQAATRTTVAGWARQLKKSGIDDGPTYDTVHSVCAMFARNLTAIAGMPWANEFKASMLDLERTLARIVDRPPDSWFAGICGHVAGPHDGSSCACACHVEHGDEIACELAHECDVPGGCGREYDGSPCTQVLYANATQVTITCRICGTEYDVDDRRDELLDQASDRLATVELIVRIVTTLGDREASTAKMSARIRQWSKRERIKAYGMRVVDGRERPVYRVGDVLDLLARDERKTS